MTPRKAKLPKDILKKINAFRDKDIVEIRKIKVRWAYGVNRKYRKFPLRGYRFFYVDLKYLIDSADFGEMMSIGLNPQKLFNGVDERDYRIAMLLDHWSKDGYIDPPEIGLNNSGRISFGDGRHRTITAFHLGEKEIPVVIHSSLVKRVSAVIKLERR